MTDSFNGYFHVPDHGGCIQNSLLGGALSRLHVPMSGGVCVVNGAVLPVSSSNATDLPNAKEAEAALMAALTAGDQQAVERAEAALKSAARAEKFSHEERALSGSVDGVSDGSQVTSLHAAVGA